MLRGVRPPAVWVMTVTGSAGVYAPLPLERRCAEKKANSPAVEVVGAAAVGEAGCGAEGLSESAAQRGFVQSGPVWSSSPHHQQRCSQVQGVDRQARPWL